MPLILHFNEKLFFIIDIDIDNSPVAIYISIHIYIYGSIILYQRELIYI